MRQDIQKNLLTFCAVRDAMIWEGRSSIFPDERLWGHRRASATGLKGQAYDGSLWDFVMFCHVLSCFGSFLQLRWLRHVFGSLCGSPLREPALFADSTGQQVAFAVGRQLAIRHVAKQHVPCIHWSISLTSLQVEYVTLTAIGGARCKMKILKSCIKYHLPDH